MPDEVESGMFQTRRIQVEAVQCMACGRFRVEGVWVHQDIHVREVSHTFCPDCVPAVREGLQREREFRRQGLERQVQMLREELLCCRMDEEGLRRRIDGLQVQSPDVETIVERCRDLLTERICRYCGQPLPEGEPVATHAGYDLHKGCSEKMLESLQEMRRIQAPESKVDAYLDILRVPHEVRDGVKRLLELG